MGILVGTRKGLFIWEKQQGRWQITRTAFLGDPVPSLQWVSEQGYLYAVLGTGHFGTKLHRSSDRGISWQEVATPSYPPKPESSKKSNKDDNIEDNNTEDNNTEDSVPWSLELIWTIATDGSHNLWCGTIPGGLFQSKDWGESWQLNQALWQSPDRAMWAGGGYDYPGIHSICIDPGNPNVLTVALSIGGVQESRDAGESWQSRGDGLRADYVPSQLSHVHNRQDPHRILQCPAEPNVFWMQHHNGIFISRDHSVTWQELENVMPSAFGFALAVHPQDADTAWFIPAIKDESRIPVGGRLVVNRTRDGGRSFEQLTKGLPQAHAYDLVYRHALDVDSTGETLAFGSTTGNLWLSNNQGESWQNLSNTLPPVFTVQFF